MIDTIQSNATSITDLAIAVATNRQPLNTLSPKERREVTAFLRKAGIKLPSDAVSSLAAKRPVDKNAATPQTRHSKVHRGSDRISNAKTGPRRPRWTAEEAAAISERIERARIIQKSVRASARELAEGIVHRFGGRPAPKKENDAEISARRYRRSQRAPDGQEPSAIEQGYSLAGRSELEFLRALARAPRPNWDVNSTSALIKNITKDEALALDIWRAIYARAAFHGACLGVNAKIKASMPNLISAPPRRPRA
jgi:hypothetical protein